MSIEQRLEEATSKAESASQVAYEWVNGDDETVVPTDGGPLPSIKKSVKDTFDPILEILNKQGSQAEQKAEEAAISASQALEYKNESENARDIAVAAKDAAEGFADSAGNSATTATTEANRSKDEADRAAGYADTMANGMMFIGLWDASNNTLPPAPTTGSAQWKISAAGVLDGNPVNVGDTLIYSANDDTFLFLDTRDQVTSVNGRLGAITGLAELSQISPVGLSGDYNDLTNGPSLAISNWNTAFGWGNHASAGYALASEIDGDVSGLQEQINKVRVLALAGIVL